ncbi:acyltransferase, partial [Polaribacter sp. Z014]|uniref:acyltransferase n=1 Tax=Polaribacter sp. Z014 TaxID=2927126 RepID=UPI0020212FE5
FFFLSGVLFSSKRYTSFIKYVTYKTKTLFLPFISLALLFVLLDWNTYLQPKVSIPSNLFAILMGSGPAKASPLWFVFILYCINLLYYWVDTKLETVSIKIIAILISSFLGYICFLKNIHLPFHVEVSFSALTFLGTGNILKKYIFKLESILGLHKLWLMVIIVSLFCISFSAGIANFGAVLGQNIINNYGLFYISAFSGILGVILLINYLIYLFDKVKAIDKIFHGLIYIAKNALPILGAQCYVIIIVDSIIKYGFTEEQQLFAFFAKIVALVLSMYLFIIPISFNKLYFLFGKEKQSWRSLLIIKQQYK